MAGGAQNDRTSGTERPGKSKSTFLYYAWKRDLRTEAGRWQSSAVHLWKWRPSGKQCTDCRKYHGWQNTWTARYSERLPHACTQYWCVGWDGASGWKDRICFSDVRQKGFVWGRNESGGNTAGRWDGTEDLSVGLWMESGWWCARTDPLYIWPAGTGGKGRCPFLFKRRIYGTGRSDRRKSGSPFGRIL